MSNKTAYQNEIKVQLKSVGNISSKLGKYLSDNRNRVVQMNKVGFGSSTPRFQETFKTKTGLQGIKLNGSKKQNRKKKVKSSSVEIAIDPEARREELIRLARERASARVEDDVEDDSIGDETTPLEQLDHVHGDLRRELMGHRFLVGGSYAARKYGSTRLPGDLDVMCRNEDAVGEAHRKLSHEDSAFDAGHLAGSSFKMTHVPTSRGIDVGLLGRHMETDSNGEIGGEAESGGASMALIMAGYLTRWEAGKEDESQLQEMITRNHLQRDYINQVLPKVKEGSLDLARERWNSLKFT
jgi:hypothetical protein